MHFIQDFVLNTIPLALVHHDERHTIENIKMQLQNVLESWDIPMEKVKIYLNFLTRNSLSKLSSVLFSGGLFDNRWSTKYPRCFPGIIWRGPESLVLCTSTQSCREGCRLAGRTAAASSKRSPWRPSLHVCWLQQVGITISEPVDTRTS